jgi:hypothetical protein
MTGEGVGFGTREQTPRLHARRLGGCPGEVETGWVCQEAQGPRLTREDEKDFCKIWGKASGLFAPRRPWQRLAQRLPRPSNAPPAPGRKVGVRVPPRPAPRRRSLGIVRVKLVRRLEGVYSLVEQLILVPLVPPLVPLILEPAAAASARVSPLPRHPASTRQGKSAWRPNRFTKASRVGYQAPRPRA